MSAKEEIFEAILYENNIKVVELTLPKIINQNGLILIKCYIEKTFFKVPESIIVNPFEKLSGKFFEIHARTKQNSKIIFKDVTINKTQYPSCKFAFICLSKSIEIIDSPNQNTHYKNYLYSIYIEGLKLEYENTSKIIKERHFFGEDESRTISLNRDSLEIFLTYFFRNKGFQFQIALIEDEKNKNSVILKFFGPFKLEYRYYKFIKKSLVYFLSYISGTNLMIRSETYQFNNKHYINEFSFKKIKKIGTNEYLPISDIHFRNENILQDYFKTFENYLILDKHLNISEVIYLINQSKKVNIESSFFILLIAIEKLSDSLLKSNFNLTIKSTIIDDKIFKELIKSTKETFKSTFQKNISKSDFGKMYSKLCNINLNGKTDNKIEVLMEFTEIKTNDDIDNLFPFLRNIAIHEGNIDFPKGNAHKNYKTLTILINEIICNLLQFKGKRLVKVENNTNYIMKKENYKIDYKNYR